MFMIIIFAVVPGVRNVYSGENGLCCMNKKYIPNLGVVIQVRFKAYCKV